MAENTSKLVQKIVKAGIIGGLCLLPVVSNGQKVAEPLEKINWTKQQKTSYDKYTLLINSKNSLPELSRYKSRVPNEYLFNGGNLNLYPNHYEIPQDQIKGPIANYLRKIDVCPECCPKTKRTISKGKGKLGKIPTPPKPVEKPIVPPSKLEKTVEEPDTLRNFQKESQGINYNINETNITNNYTTTNNYLPSEEVRKMSSDTLRKTLEFRILMEASKAVNAPFGGASINPQIVIGPFSAGLYTTFGFGKLTDFFSTPVDKETLLNQTLKLFTRTKGNRTQTTKLSYPMEFGGIASLNSENDRVRLNFGYGFARQEFSTDGITESGIDFVRQGDDIIEEKPYSFEIEKGKTEKKWIQSRKIGLDVKPFKKLNAYLGFEVQQRRGDFRDLNFNAKAGWTFGGRKK
jgi:hypothetical protein